MNNKVTLPPISDIFTNKNAHRLDALPLPQSHTSGYNPMMPLHSYQYLNAAARAASTSLPEPSASSTPSYLYGSSYSGSITPPTSLFGSAITLPAPIRTIGRTLVGLVSRRGSLQLPPLLPLSPNLTLASPEASESTLQNTRSRTRNNLPKETTHILLKWLNEHLNHPYPNSFEKTQLMMTTGLSQQQLSNWFINARRRKIKVLRQKHKLLS